MFFIKKYTFIFGDPVISFSVVLSGILFFSGAGGYVSRRMGPQGLCRALMALIAVLFLMFCGLDLLIGGILALPVIVRYLVAVLLLAPAGFGTGLPFPLGMRLLLNQPGERAYAWSANGCASVLTSIASAQIALSLGIPTILACGAAAYLLAYISIKNFKF